MRLQGAQNARRQMTVEQWVKEGVRLNAAKEGNVILFHKIDPDPAVETQVVMALRGTQADRFLWEAVTKWDGVDGAEHMKKCLTKRLFKEENTNV